MTRRFTVDFTDALRTPERRLIRESRSHPINLVNSGRFSSHWFIILTDVLVHVGYSGHVVYPLDTIWVEPLQDTETQVSYFEFLITFLSINQSQSISMNLNVC